MGSLLSLTLIMSTSSASSSSSDDEQKTVQFAPLQIDLQAQPNKVTIDFDEGTVETLSKGVRRLVVI